jgi:hypothetical protein
MRAQGVSEEIRKRHAWLELLQVSGPFLTLPVVHRVFPNGLPEVPVQKRAAVRALVAQMMDDRGASRHAVIRGMLRDVFDWQQHLVLDDAIPQNLAEIVADHGITLRPDFGYFDEAEDDAAEDADAGDEHDSSSPADSEWEEPEDDEDPEGGDAEADSGGASSGPWKLLGMVTAWGTHPLTRTTTGTWTANAVERLAVLLRARDVPVGIVTDGRWWALVTAPRGAATGAAVWDASLFSEEPRSLEGLVALLTRSRFQAAQPKDKLPALFAESLERQEEVTEQLGRQVRDAVELLITTLDQLDRESNGTLLAGVSDVPDSGIAESVLPALGLLRYDDLGRPSVFPPGSRYVTRSHRRAATGTHYTPRSLAEEVAEGALQPLVYRPGPLETSDTTQWRIRPSKQILELKVADIAMGSGAFLVAACRYLADHLIKAWLDEGDAEALAMDLHRTAGRVGADAEADQLLLKARREITEHCLYGVDINPLAVEMAKLSLWLITMDTERPFGFLDDRLAAGDSLLGLVSLEQLESLHVDAKEGRRLHHGTLDFASEWRDKLAQAADLRRKITTTGGVTIRDIEHKARLLAQAEKLSGQITTVADAITAAGLANAKLAAGDSIRHSCPSTSRS